MTNFAILTDSCSDLTAPLRERFGVDGYVPGALVYPDGSNHYADLDWKNMTPAQFFGTMKDKKGGLFTSAQIGLQDVAEPARAAAAAGPGYPVRRRVLGPERYIQQHLPRGE